MLDNFVEQINVLFTKVADKGKRKILSRFVGLVSCLHIVLQVWVLRILDS